MAISSAWLLDLGSGFRAAVGAQELQHLVDGPQVTRVSSLSAHCNETFVWQGETLSVIDFATWLEAGGALPSESQRPLVGVFAYYAQPGVTPKFGAISLASIPQRIQVNDTQASALPEDFSVWKKIAISCFTHDGKAVPIIDLSALFKLAGPENVLSDNSDQQVADGVSGF